MTITKTRVFQDKAPSIARAIWLAIFREGDFFVYIRFSFYWNFCYTDVACAYRNAYCLLHGVGIPISKEVSGDKHRSAPTLCARFFFFL